MKKRYLLSAFFILSAIYFLKAQEEKQSKFSIIAFGGIGYGIVENDNAPNYNLNSNSGELLLNYNIYKGIGLATGIGVNQLSGNGFNTSGNFYHERSLLKMPLLGTLDYNISEKLSMIGNFGFYTQTIINDSYQYLTTNQNDVYKGWNFGAQIGVGFLYQLFDNFSAGVNFNAQSDFSKFKTSNNAPLNDRQLLNNLTTTGIILKVEL